MDPNLKSRNLATLLGLLLLCILLYITAFIKVNNNQAAKAKVAMVAHKTKN